MFLKRDKLHIYCLLTRYNEKTELAYRLQRKCNPIVASHSRRSIIFNIIRYNIFIDPKQVAIIQSRLKNTIEILKYQQL